MRCIVNKAGTRYEEHFENLALMSFYRANSEFPYSGSESLKEMVKLCPGLEYPERIHSRKLRKYLATTCQV